MEINSNEQAKSAFCILVEEAIKDLNKEQSYEKLEVLLKTLVFGCMHREKIMAAAELAQDASTADNGAVKFSDLRLRYLMNENKEVFAIVYTSKENYEVFPSGSTADMYLYDVLMRVMNDESVKALVINPNTDLCYMAEKVAVKAVLDIVNDNLKGEKS